MKHLADSTAPASYFGPDGSRARRLETIREADREAIVLEAMETRRFHHRPNAGR